MIIYKTINLLNNKIYIGQTNGKKKYYIGSGKYLIKAFKKYGKSNFKFEIITQGDFNQYLTDTLERHYIRLYNSTNKNIGYNLELGGLRSNQRRIKTITGYKLSKEFCEAVRKRRLGTKTSEETKKKLSEINKGKKKSLNHAANIGKSKWIPIIQLDLEGNFIKEWNCISNIEKELGLSSKNICGVCKNHYGRKSVGGFKWEYKPKAK